MPMTQRRFGAARPLEPAEGRVAVPGGTVWYRVAGSGRGTPLLLVHGGPGMPSHYFQVLETLGDERPVISYDQLGCGRSDRPSDPALWTTARFVEELAALRDALGLERVALLGHSWGGALAAECALAGARGVVALILASPLLSASRWVDDAERLRRELPADVEATLRRHEAAGTTDSPEYEAATNVFYRAFVCRKDPWPAEMLASLAGFGREPYLAMWGPSEFHVTGTLRSFDVTGRLGTLSKPTLFTVGRFDEARPETVASFQALVPGSRLMVFERSAHMTMLDEPEAYVTEIRRFLRGVDGR